MRASLVFIAVVLYETLCNVSSNAVISCKTFKSTVSLSSSGATKSAECDPLSSYQTLVSCGFSTKDAKEENVGGSWIQNGKCWARNAENGAGVYAWARCCNFEQTVSCTPHFGSFVSGDDALSSVQCSSSEYMLGCTAYTISQYFDGIYPASLSPASIPTANTGSSHAYDNTRICNGQNGLGSNTRSSINCCTADLGLKCNIYYAAKGADNSLQCPSHQSMMSCMAWEPHNDANAWYISGSTCYTRTFEQDVYTSAICCNEITPSPTRDPTKCPTSAPSKHPTTATPTNQPSKSPSHPSAAPTIPTSDPTADPTRTRAPTVDPTEATTEPSDAPSQSPTEHTQTPTTAPTSAPSPDPTRATRDPTKTPTPQTNHPTTAPSKPSTSPTEQPSKTPSITVTETTDDNGEGQGNESKEKGGFTDDNDNKSKERLYLILFVIFGALFCCLLSGLCAYFYFKNKKQESEVRYENAAVAFASKQKQKQKDEDQDDDDILPGINALSTEGVADNGTGTGTVPVNTSQNTTQMVDASMGIRTAGGETRMSRGTDGHKYSAAAASSGSTSPGITGMSEEDEEKSPVFKVEM